jgi:hypothetical protein
MILRIPQLVMKVRKIITFSNPVDELAWAAAWMHRATGENTYLNGTFILPSLLTFKMLLPFIEIAVFLTQVGVLVGEKKTLESTFY